MCCNKFRFCLGNLIYIAEKLASCCALTAVVTCLITTVILMLIFGIGLGYNYCFVDFKAKRADEFFTSRSTFTTTPKTIPTTSITQETTTEITTPAYHAKYRPGGPGPQGGKGRPGDSIVPPRRRAKKIRRKITDNSKSTESAVNLSSPGLVKQTMIVPLDSSVDISALLSKIIGLKKNFTLELIIP